MKGANMTNYDKLFQEQMENPKFSKAYDEAKSERNLDNILEELKEKITMNESKEVLLQTINAFQHQI